MHYPTKHAPVLESIEEQYGDTQAENSSLFERIRPSWQLRADTKAHQKSKFNRDLSQTVHSSAVSHLREVISNEVLYAEKGVRPAYIALAEHSMDQLIETIHHIAEIKLASIQEYDL